VWIDKLCCYYVAVGMCGLINCVGIVWLLECVDCILCWYCVAFGMCGLINCVVIVWLLECVD